MVAEAKDMQVNGRASGLHREEMKGVQEDGQAESQEGTRTRAVLLPSLSLPSSLQFPAGLGVTD